MYVFVWLRFKTGCGACSFINANWDGLPFMFLGFQVWKLMQTNLGPFVIAMILIFYFFNWWWGFVGTILPQFRRN